MVKPEETDPEKKWITTWNHYLNHLKIFFRWLYNIQFKKGIATDDFSEWITPDFIRIKMKRTKRLSPYSQTEIWERDELLFLNYYNYYFKIYYSIINCNYTN